MHSVPSVRRFASRQALFFLLAIVVPCALLIVLTVGMIVQDAEITRTGAEEQKRRLAADVRQELLARLERIGSRPTGPEVVFVARIAGSQLILPWEDDPAVRAAASDLQGRAFRQALEPGERHEASGAFGEALNVYRSVDAASRGVLQRATAQRNAARVLVKSGRPDAARHTYLRLLDTAPAAVDDEGVPMVLWAARGLTGLRSDASLDDRIAAALAGVLDSPALPPAALYMTRDVARLLDAPALSRRIAARLEDVERASDLQGRSAAVASVLDEGSPHGRWRSFGDPADPWFVGPGPDALQVVVVRAGPLLDDLHTLGGAALGVYVAPAGEGESLAPAFPQLVLRFPRDPPATIGSDAGIRQSTYLAVLVVVLCMAMSGAYLFSRDVRRELRTAEMRSQFVSGVSHELKTPLTAIRMLSETLLLRRAPRLEAREEYLETIVQACERLTRVPTITSASRSRCGSCSPGCGRSCAARRLAAPCPMSSASATSRSTSGGTRRGGAA